MKSGLEEFLKRIEAKPTNETLIDRFMTLVLEEDGIDRILYLKSLVGLLLKTNPYAALKAAYVELQEARKEQLTKEYEIGALKDVESCFINLGRSENAALVREEISKLQGDSRPPQHNQMPVAPPPAKRPIEADIPQVRLEDAFAPVKSERTQMAPPPSAAPSREIARAPEPVKAAPPRAIEPKPIPSFTADELKPPSGDFSIASAAERTQVNVHAKASAPVQSAAPLPRSTPPVEALPSHNYSTYVEEDIFVAPADLPENIRSKANVGRGVPQPVEEAVESPASLASNFSLTAEETVPRQVAPNPFALATPTPSATVIPTPSPFATAPSFMDAPSFKPDFPSEEQVESEKAGEDGEGGFGLSLEYTKRAKTPTPTESSFHSNASLGSGEGGFSLKDDDDEEAFIPISSEIDEKYENQPFFQPDDDDDDAPPPAERTMIISLEKLNESLEQIDLASGASVDAAYPVNSGHNFVILDSDDDMPTAAEAEAAHDFAPATLDAGQAPAPFSAADFDPNKISNDNTYNPAPFVFDETAPPLSSSDFGLLLESEAPEPSAATPNVTFAPTPMPSPDPVTFPAASSGFDAFQALAPLPEVAPASATPQVVPLSMPDAFAFTKPPATPVEMPAAESLALSDTAPQPELSATPIVVVHQVAAPVASAVVETAVPHPQPPVFDLAPAEPELTPLHAVKEEPLDIKVLGNNDPIPEPIDLVADEEEEVNHLTLVPTPSLVEKWTRVQERLQLFSGMQINRSHGVDFVKRLLNAKTETPLVVKTVGILMQFVESKLTSAKCTRISLWLFEELSPQAMHQLWESLNLKEEGLELYLLHIESLQKSLQYRRALSVMRDILRFDLDVSWYKGSYPLLLKAWEHLGLEGWIWLEEEGGAEFCDKLARREDPLLETLFV